MIEPLGPISVPTPGTPVSAASVLPSSYLGVRQSTSEFKCHAALFQAKPANTGKVYIGKTGMNKSTLDGVAAVLAIPTANTIPAFSVALTLAPSGIELSTLVVDADIATDGVLLTILVT